MISVMRSHRFPIFVLLGLFASLPSACSKKTVAPVAVVDPGPTANSPANAVKRLEWAYANRRPDALAGLFTDDFGFQFAFGDSAGNSFRANPWGRTDESTMSTRMFVGQPDCLPARRIDLSLAQTLVALNDSRPGKSPRWHKQIRSSVEFHVEIDHGDGSTDLRVVQGNALFFLVRGDSAAIPPELVSRGYVPDSTRWWIQHWEDETLPAGGALRAQPTRGTTWGEVKVLYR